MLLYLLHYNSPTYILALSNYVVHAAKATKTSREKKNKERKKALGEMKGMGKMLVRFALG